MREIKFRVWDKYDKKFWTDHQWSEDFAKDLQNDDRYVFQQFTGLKDKNGKEIYEGDIVKWGHHCEWCKENPIRIAEVKINPDIQFDAKNIDYIFHFGAFAYQDTDKHLEVIGNIWENPELLKVAKK